MEQWFRCLIWIDKVTFKLIDYVKFFFSISIHPFEGEQMRGQINHESNGDSS